jgi:phosphotransferase system enzyme I (PtsI)
MHPARISTIKQRVLRADTRLLRNQIAGVLESDDPAQAWHHATRGKLDR